MFLYFIYNQNFMFYVGLGGKAICEKNQCNLCDLWFP